MKIGIGLPNPVPGVDGRTLVEWARRAEGRGFSSVATAAGVPSIFATTTKRSVRETTRSTSGRT